MSKKERPFRPKAVVRDKTAQNDTTMNETMLPQHTKTTQNSQDIGDHSASVQRARILAYLRSGKTLTTLEARAILDVLHPAARVLELRRLGFQIQTIRTNDLSQAGKIHRVARYILCTRRACK